MAERVDRTRTRVQARIGEVVLDAVLLSEQGEPSRGPRGRRRLPGHLHWFRWVGRDPFSSASLYACRCGEVRPGF